MLQSYKVKIKDNTNWQDFNTCRLQISVGIPKHEGQKFKALIKWCLSNKRFDRIVVCVNDTLQRFNVAFEKNGEADDFHEYMKEAGRSWYDNNLAPLMSSIDIPVEVHFWDEWESHDKFAERLRISKEFYNTNTVFRNAIDENIQTFWVRKQKSNREIYLHERYEAFKRLSIEYLLYETAAFSIMFEEQEAVDIYPGSFLLPAVLFRGSEPVEGMPPGLNKGAFLRIDYSRD